MATISAPAVVFQVLASPIDWKWEPHRPGWPRTPPVIDPDGSSR